MKTRRLMIRFPLLISLFLLILMSGNVRADDFRDLPVKGMVTMIDIGAKKCIPCKMMAPIMEKMEKVYKGKAIITFINFWEHREPVNRFRIRVIPTQIFSIKTEKRFTGMKGFWLKKML